MDWAESTEAIEEVDELLARVGLGHGRRRTRAGTWMDGERQTRVATPAATGKAARPAARRTAGAAVWVAGWEKFAWLRHGFSTRMGGVSTIYGEGSLNLGWTKEDDAANVA